MTALCLTRPVSVNWSHYTLATRGTIHTNGNNIWGINEITWIQKYCLFLVIIQCNKLIHIMASYKFIMEHCLCPSVVRPSLNFFFKRHILLNHWSKFHITSHESFPWYPLQNCINDFAPPNRSATRAPEKKSFKPHLQLNHWPKFKIISQNCFS